MTVDRWIAVISLVIGFAAVIFGIWAYKRGEKRRVPTFVTSTTPEALVKPVVSQLKDFSITHKGIPVGGSGVTSVYIYFWNDGELPILRADVISPYKITFPKGVRILDIATTTATRPILGIKSTIISNQDSESLEIEFDVLEPADGLKLQVIYDGPQDTQLAFEGSCIGSFKVKVLAPDPTYFVSRRQRFENALGPVDGLLFVGATVGLIVGAEHLMSKYVKNDSLIEYCFFVLFGLLALCLMGVVIREQYKKWTASTVPPEIRSS